jgi:hypothetical protein
MSGTTSFPASESTRSAAEVVGPFATSTMTGARIRSALSAVIWSSSAAGISTSTSSSRSSSFVTTSASTASQTEPLQ